ncbi:MAG: NAD(+) synthase, partial [Clostridiaceae bacterium]|nr:NAD(+) synthase [Clostridiaceae bacterium]
SREERRWFSDPFASELSDHDAFSCELIAGTAEGGMTGIMEVRLDPATCPTILRHAIDDPPLFSKENEADGLPGFDFSLCGITAQNLQSFTFPFVNLCTVIPCLAVRPSLLPHSVHDSHDLRLFNFEPSHAVDALAHGSIPVAAIPDGRQEWTGDYRRLRRELIRRSLRDHSIVLYAGSGPGESVSSGVYAGHRLIISDGRVLAESVPFTTGMTLADLAAEDLFRVRNNAGTHWDILKNGREKTKADKPDRLPFLMRGELDAANFFEETLTIQGRGLSGRLRFLGARPVLGLSGGLDSAVAFLACLEAVRLLERPPSDIIAVSMPGPGTSEMSRKLARQLGEAAGLDFREISIDEAIDQHLADIGYRGDRSDVTFENAQARERTQILMDLANLEGGIVVGTGDLSELALGWCTYNGDQMSMYAVNASLPKTVIREMASQAAALLEKERFPLITDRQGALTAAKALRTILARPVSPELLLPAKDGSPSQLTEEVVGPYELIDFFIWYLIFDQKKPSAVLDLARQAFEGEYGLEEIAGWMESFIRRFFKSQFKRTASPEGISVLPRRLVPLTAWQMPGDAAADLWIRELTDYMAQEAP